MGNSPFFLILAKGNKIKDSWLLQPSFIPRPWYKPTKIGSNKKSSKGNLFWKPTLLNSTIFFRYEDITIIISKKNQPLLLLCLSLRRYYGVRNVFKILCQITVCELFCKLKSLQTVIWHKKLDKTPSYLLKKGALTLFPLGFVTWCTIAVIKSIPA